jgi:hypothetical protein
MGGILRHMLPVKLSIVIATADGAKRPPNIIGWGGMVPQRTHSDTSDTGTLPSVRVYSKQFAKVEILKPIE